MVQFEIKAINNHSSPAARVRYGVSLEGSASGLGSPPAIAEEYAISCLIWLCYDETRMYCANFSVRCDSNVYFAAHGCAEITHMRRLNNFVTLNASNMNTK